MPFGELPDLILEEMHRDLIRADELICTSQTDKALYRLRQTRRTVEALIRTAHTDYPLQVAREAAQRFREAGNRKDETFAVETLEALIQARTERDIYRKDAKENYEKAAVNELSALSIDAIRSLLDGANVPRADFIDDHVGNAVVQRNQLFRLVALLLTQARHEPTESPERIAVIAEVERSFERFKLNEIFKPEDIVDVPPEADSPAS